MTSRVSQKVLALAALAITAAIAFTPARAAFASEAAPLAVAAQDTDHGVDSSRNLVAR